MSFLRRSISQFLTLLLLILCASIGKSAALNADEQGDSSQAENIAVVPEHLPYEGTFTLTNIHDVAVRIADVQAACTCDKLTLEDHFLLPGQSITVEFEVENHNTSGERLHKIWFLLSDANLDALEHSLHWQVEPSIAVDSMPSAGPFDQRPRKSAQDIYQFFTRLRPDALDRLNRADRKILRIWSPTADLEQLDINIDGFTSPLWDFVLKRQDSHSWLLISKLAENSAPPLGVHQETLVINTNHPHKPQIELILNSQVDPMVGSPDLADPWANLRP